MLRCVNYLETLRYRDLGEAVAGASRTTISPKKKDRAILKKKGAIRFDRTAPLMCQSRIFILAKSGA